MGRLLPPDAVTLAGVLFLVLTLAIAPSDGRRVRLARWLGGIGLLGYLLLSYWMGGGAGLRLAAELSWAVGWGGFALLAVGWRWMVPFVALVALVQALPWLGIPVGDVSCAALVVASGLVLVIRGWDRGTALALTLLVLLLVHGAVLLDGTTVMVEKVALAVGPSVMLSWRGRSIPPWDRVLVGSARSIGGALFITGVFLLMWKVATSFADLVVASVVVGLAVSMLLELWNRSVAALLERALLHNTPSMLLLERLVGALQRHAGPYHTIIPMVVERLREVERPSRWLLLEYRHGALHHHAREVDRPDEAVLEELRDGPLQRTGPGDDDDPVAMWMRSQGLDAVWTVLTDPHLVVLAAGAAPSLTARELKTLELVAATLRSSMERSLKIRRIQDRERLSALGEMAAGLAHEIRNPLAAIKGAAELLEEEGSPFAAIVIQESERLSRVLTSFLDYARPFEIAPVDTDLRDVVERSVSALAPRFKGIELQLVVPPSEVRALVDPDRIQQVLMNILANAAEAVSETRSPRVVVRLREDGGAAMVEIEDNGPGIAEDVLPKLFTPFFTTKEGGTGLGLAISYKLVALHGGTIEVESVPGKTVFTVVLPRK